MITVRDNSPRFTPEEYFAWEEQQLERYELIDGQAYAMSSGTINQGRIAIKITAMLDSHLDDSSCITGNSDVRINILETTDYSYPDASVTCDERDKTNTQHISYPCLIVEVLSDSTEAYDRSKKFYRYRCNPILKEYVLVSGKSISVDLYRKNDLEEWVITQYRLGDIVELFFATQPSVVT